jgi:hypothetical protein
VPAEIDAVVVSAGEAREREMVVYYSTSITVNRPDDTESHYKSAWSVEATIQDLIDKAERGGEWSSMVIVITQGRGK